MTVPYWFTAWCTWELPTCMHPGHFLPGKPSRLATLPCYISYMSYRSATSRSGFESLLLIFSKVKHCSHSLELLCLQKPPSSESRRSPPLPCPALGFKPLKGRGVASFCCLCLPRSLWYLSTWFTLCSAEGIRVSLQATKGPSADRRVYETLESELQWMGGRGFTIQKGIPCMHRMRALDQMVSQQKVREAPLAGNEYHGLTKKINLWHCLIDG